MEADIPLGHNSSASPEVETALRGYAERIVSLEDEIATSRADIREVFAEAKSHGFDTKTLRHAIRLYQRDRATLHEEMTTLRLYCRALGFDLI